jgi:uncharacterized protein YjiS (DUF1127 family)
MLKTAEGNSSPGSNDQEKHFHRNPPSKRRQTTVICMIGGYPVACGQRVKTSMPRRGRYAFLNAPPVRSLEAQRTEQITQPGHCLATAKRPFDPCCAGTALFWTAGAVAKAARASFQQAGRPRGRRYRPAVPTRTLAHWARQKRTTRLLVSYITDNRSGLADISQFGGFHAAKRDKAMSISSTAI